MCKAIESLSDLPIKMLTLHSSSGPEAMIECKKVATNCLPSAKLLAVTVLTSMNRQNLRSIGIDMEIIEQVNNLANLAVESGISGIVSSPLELVKLRPKLPQETIFVTPGIRPTGSVSGDQKRVMTPKQASAAGANYLVIGRPILEAQCPKSAL